MSVHPDLKAMIVSIFIFCTGHLRAWNQDLENVCGQLDSFQYFCPKASVLNTYLCAFYLKRKKNRKSIDDIHFCHCRLISISQEILKCEFSQEQVWNLIYGNDSNSICSVNQTY